MKDRKRPREGGSAIGSEGRRRGSGVQRSREEPPNRHHPPVGYNSRSQPTTDNTLMLKGVAAPRGRLMKDGTGGGEGGMEGGREGKRRRK